MSRQKLCDLLFVRILYLLVHLGLLCLFGHHFSKFIWQYQTYDDSIRAMLYDPQLKGINVSLVIDHILTQSK